MHERGSWKGQYGTFAARLVALMITGQIRNAALAAAYIPAVLAETGQATAPVGTLVPAALAGVASSGLPLDSTLYGAVVTAGQAFNAGAGAAEALASGADALSTLVLSQLQDTARVGASVTMTADPKVTGWVRMLQEPSCSRCIILAGRVYKYSDGFQRHPNCDCRHIPASEDAAGDLRTDPEAYFASLSRAEQDRIFGEDAAQAIRLGADINQVVNAERGMRDTVLDGQTLKTTLSSTTNRGVFRGKGPRLMPETIMQLAASRADAIRLLRVNGYITAR